MTMAVLFFEKYLVITISVTMILLITTSLWPNHDRNTWTYISYWHNSHFICEIKKVPDFKLKNILLLQSGLQKSSNLYFIAKLKNSFNQQKMKKIKIITISIDGITVVIKQMYIFMIFMSKLWAGKKSVCIEKENCQISFSGLFSRETFGE